MTSRPNGAAPTHGPGAIVAVLAACSMVCSFQQTIVTPLLPHLPRLLDTTLPNASWVITATLIAAAVSTPISGRLADLYGKRTVALGVLGIMTLGSALAAVSTGLWWLVFARALQGVGISLIPLSISIARDALPADRVNRGVSLISSTLGVGAALGMPLAALVVEAGDWHYVFWMSTVLSVSAGIVLYRVVPADPSHPFGGFDVTGALGLTLWLSAALLAVTKGLDWGLGSPNTLTALAVSAVALTIWIRHQWKHRAPLVDLRVSIRAPVLLTNLAAAAIGFAVFVSVIVLPKLLQDDATVGAGLGHSILVASLCLVPNGLMMMAVSSWAGAVMNRVGARICLAIGAAVIALGYVLALFAMSSLWEVVFVGVVLGAGTGFAFGALPVLIMASVPNRETGAANGLNALMRSIGTSSSSAVSAVVLAYFAIDGHDDVTTAGGYRVIFIIAAALALVAAVLTRFIHPRQLDERELHV